MSSQIVMTAVPILRCGLIPEYLFCLRLKRKSKFLPMQARNIGPRKTNQKYILNSEMNYVIALSL